MNINIKDLKIVNRGRKDLGDIAGLAESIKKFGLINPVLVQPLVDDAQYKYELIAGERRTRASIFAGLSTIVATTRDECSELMKKELELEENIQRKELLWSEQCQMMLMLDEIKRAEHGSLALSSGNRHTQDLTWSLKDTATTLNKSIGSVAQDIKLAKAMKEDPKLALELQRLPKCAAFKKLQSIEERKKLERLYKGKKCSTTDAILNGSCLNLIKDVESESIDLILTDPPFAVEKINEAKGTYNKLRDENDNSDILVMEELYTKLVPEIYRVLKPGGHIYMFFGNEWYPFLTAIFKRHCFNVDPVPIIWNKGRTTTPFRGYNYQQCYEPILFMQKNPRESRRLEKPTSNIITFSPVDQKTKQHVYHKPPALIDFLIQQSTAVGQKVLDPFCGSGQTIKSAINLRREALGFELNVDHYRKALEYIKEM